MTKQEILAGLRACAKKLGRAPKQSDLLKMTKITRYWITRHFTDVMDAYREAGILRQGAPHRIDSLTLLEDWVRVARKVGRPPTRTDYLNQGKYSAMPFFRLCGQWSRVPEYLRAFARDRHLEEKWGDVLKMIEGRAKAASARVSGQIDLRSAEPGSAGLTNACLSNKAGEDMPVAVRRGRRAGGAAGRPGYGTPGSLLRLRYEPGNELGLLYFFRILAPGLRRQVEREKPGLPPW